MRDPHSHADKRVPDHAARSGLKKRNHLPLIMQCLVPDCAAVAGPPTHDNDPGPNEGAVQRGLNNGGAHVDDVWVNMHAALGGS